MYNFSSLHVSLRVFLLVVVDDAWLGVVRVLWLQTLEHHEI